VKSRVAPSTVLESAIESLLEEAGLGNVSKNEASRICRDLRARYQAFRARSLVIRSPVLEGWLPD
jgi:transposase-like protein